MIAEKKRRFGASCVKLYQYYVQDAVIPNLKNASDMKTKLLFLVACLCSGAGLSAQEYHPLLEQPTWVVYDWVSCCRPPITKVIEAPVDAVIGSHTYKKFVDPFPQWSVSPSVLMDTIYLREDADARKIYKIVNGADELLYDFSLETDDEITLKGVAFTATVDEIAVNAGMRKRITLKSVPLFNGGHVYQTWIEGVGTNAHPFYPDFFMYAPVYSSGGGYRVYTQCSFLGSTHVFGDPEYCGAFAPLGTMEHQATAGVFFSPNPMGQTLFIDASQALDNAQLNLYNANGQCVRRVYHLNGNKITVARENLASGLYLAELVQDGKTIKSAKMILD